ncbi:uncharacterized protein KY384_003058 [Bacidia gigantensis]|uniref:uncharacterized protein n=1 Tax=Bacidia gigantensis TaxID=2732470 RepID=UPI001D04B27B|nr:uncharacterized protein KY384_003058 [Bacidia gigantensis]KAG8531429.1 hypothetical protein KY384_003058 [Bacidia gigantensis]
MNRSNGSSFVSKLPQSSMPSPTKHGKLNELSASATNARSRNMAPPPVKERETLKERAGRPLGHQSTASLSSLPINSSINPTTLTGGPRVTSFSASSSSRPPSSASSRVTSNSSYGGSVGHGMRPPSGGQRSHSAMSATRFQRQQYIQGRLAPAREANQEDPSTAQVLGKRKGEALFSSNPHMSPEPLQPPRLRGGHVQSDPGSTWLRRPCSAVFLREVSSQSTYVSELMNNLSLEDEPVSSAPTSTPTPCTPSRIPQKVSCYGQSAQSSPTKSLKKKTSKSHFLSRETNMVTAWDTDDKMEEMEHMRKFVKDEMRGAMAENEGLKEMTVVWKSRITELEKHRDELSANNKQLQAELDAAKIRVASIMDAVEDQKRFQNNHIDDLQRQHRRELEDKRHEAETEQRRLARDNIEQVESLERNFENQLADERAQHDRQIHTLSSEGASTQQQVQKELEAHLAAFESLEAELERCKNDIAREKEKNGNLCDQLSDAAKRERELADSVRRLEGHIHFLESDNKSQSHAFADLEARMQAALRTAAGANEKLIKEETLRRKLHNQVQELKGNIRVFCRVRPPLKSEPADSTARVSYPDQEVDAKELEVMGPEEKSSLGNVTTKKHAFSFDRVFGPASQNEDVFGEISQLVQSALDGYNVCIFCYGQTGSGKTFTMSAIDGMIPRAVNQIYSTAKSLEEKGWKYGMAGSFIEVYNENLNDLLGKAEEFDKKKHEIRHDTQKCKTEVTGIKTVELDSPGRVEEILQNAARNRTVAATQANERSSRSHSVFILKLVGENSVTGEHSEGTLNLVDLAGSERLSHSGATGDRLKETQNINKSLSCLGDVIGALGQGKDGGHVPYRNSKLTYLLQFSLGGNSKTLMFVMISPLQAHLGETLTSLKFATKVHNTHIGTAKKQTKTKD